MADTAVEYEQIAQAECALARHTTGKPGQLLLTFSFEGDQRRPMFDVVEYDHEVWRITIERMRYPGERSTDEGDVWNQQSATS